MSDFNPPAERRKQILSLLAQQGSLSVAEIVARFSVSEATARRDLETLATSAKIERVYGGATLIQQAPPELPVLQRQSEQADEKRRIGRAVAALVPDGASLFLGSGTTVLEVARNLRQHRDLTILTNSLPVFNALADLTTLNLIGLGGVFRPSELSFIGSIAEHTLGETHVDMVIIGTRAINLQQGLTNDYLPETMTDRAIIRTGQRVVLVTDHTKFGRIAVALLAPLECVHTIVTDPAIPADYLGELQARGIEVILA